MSFLDELVREEGLIGHRSGVFEGCWSRQTRRNCGRRDFKAGFTKKGVLRMVRRVRSTLREGGKVLVANHHPFLARLLEKVSQRWAGRVYILNKWVPGLVSNFQNCYRVIGTDRWRERYPGISDMTSLPDLVVLTSLYKFYSGALECANRVGCVAVSDTNSRQVSGVDCIPGNDDSLSFLERVMEACFLS